MVNTSWSDLTSALIAGKDLTYEECVWAMDEIMEGNTSPVVLAGFLVALATKGETAAELHGLGDSMQAHALPIDMGTEVLDIVGTGGDRLKTINISTTASLVIAAGGVPVVKHGNRASSSACGSADVLEVLGVNLALSQENVLRCFQELGIAFIFANVFHPSMRHVAPVRRELSVRTVFNFLGPLTNPARPAHSVIGVTSEQHAPLVASVLAECGTHSIVFRGTNGMDELSTICPNHVWEIEGGKVEYSELDARTTFGMAPATVEDIRGGDANFNAQALRRILEGENGAPRDCVLLNAAACFVAYGHHEGTRVGDGSLTDRLAVGIELAEKSIDSGAAENLLDRWIAFI